MGPIVPRSLGDCSEIAISRRGVRDGPQRGGFAARPREFTEVSGAPLGGVRDQLLTFARAARDLANLVVAQDANVPEDALYGLEGVRRCNDSVLTTASASGAGMVVGLALARGRDPGADASSRNIVILWPFGVLQ